jgi:Fic family protein
MAYKDYVETAKSLHIPDNTAQNYISEFLQKGLIHRDKQDFYIKTPAQETKDLGDC